MTDSSSSPDPPEHRHRDPRTDAEGDLGLGSGPDLDGSWFEVGPELPTAAPQPERDGADSSSRTLLTGGSAREILYRICETDALGLFPRVPAVLDRLAIIMDPHRVTRRAMAQCAHRAAMQGYCGEARLDKWLRDRIAESVEALLDEDWAEERQNLPVDPLDDRYQSVTLGSGLAPAQARRLALTFNKLPDEDRKPLFAVLVRNESLDEVARATGLSKPALKNKILAVLAVFHADPGIGDLS